MREVSGVERTYLRQRVPPYMWFTTFWILVITVLCLSLAIDGKFTNDIFIGFAIILPLFYLKFHLDRGYLISYDDRAIYMRPHGIKWNFTRAPEEVMAFADIDEVVGENEGAAMAFKYVRLYRTQWDGAEKFILSPFFINSDDMKALVLLIDQKRPGTVAADVLRVMNNPRRL
jgi:hypothetical protein